MHSSHGIAIPNSAVFVLQKPRDWLPIILVSAHPSGEPIGCFLLCFLLRYGYVSIGHVIKQILHTYMMMKCSIQYLCGCQSSSGNPSFYMRMHSFLQIHLSALRVGDHGSSVHNGRQKWPTSTMLSPNDLPETLHGRKWSWSYWWLKVCLVYIAYHDKRDEKSIWIKDNKGSHSDNSDHKKRRKPRSSYPMMKDLAVQNWCRRNVELEKKNIQMYSNNMRSKKTGSSVLTFFPLFSPLVLQHKMSSSSTPKGRRSS